RLGGVPRPPGPRPRPAQGGLLRRRAPPAAPRPRQAGRLRRRRSQPGAHAGAALGRHRRPQVRPALLFLPARPGRHRPPRRPLRPRHAPRRLGAGGLLPPPPGHPHLLRPPHPVAGHEPGQAAQPGLRRPGRLPPRRLRRQPALAVPHPPAGGGHPGAVRRAGEDGRRRLPGEQGLARGRRRAGRAASHPPGGAAPLRALPGQRLQGGGPGAGRFRIPEDGPARPRRPRRGGLMSDVHERLRRLLLVVPYVSKNPGVSVDELARTLGTTREQLLKELDLLAMVGRPPFQPDDYIDIYVEDGRVYVDLDQRLAKPPRLTASEAVALAAAAEMLRPNEGDALHTALRKLEKVLPETSRARYREMARQIDADPRGSEELVALHRAISQRLEVEFEY